ncbi:MAG TPA: GNAT family N-acetyltransferase [Kiloniellaceae bacterium]|nr:GNAT family N-acetyltransferase [Kiloniellaceae bacterium]HIP78035.1 GNAT family N-acetyltransferase [Kiloniellaceae bacterium]
MPDIALDLAWGAAGLRAGQASSTAIAIVDVLSFSTAVDVAVSRGARVLPYRYHDATAADFAAAQGARLAGPRGVPGGLSLSPPSLAALEAGDSLVLPSPNGSMLSTLVGDTPTFAACLRNATAVAAALQAAAEDRGDAKVLVVAAGEHWPDGSLRPALEDLLGAGALLARLKGAFSPDAAAAVGAYKALRGDLQAALQECPSGREQIGEGFSDDVAWAGEEDVSAAVPRLQDGAYSDSARGPQATARDETPLRLRKGGAEDDAACGQIVGAAAATSAYAPRVPHAAQLLGDRRPLAQEDRQRILAERGSRPVGFVEFRPNAQGADAQGAEAQPAEAQSAGALGAGGHVKYLFVDPAAQGQGVGAALLEAAEQALGAPVTLTVLSVNDSGLRWYMGRGYRIAGGQLEADWEDGPAIWLTLKKD